MTVRTWVWLLAQEGGVGQPFDLGQLIPVLGVSVIFIYVWLMTTKELKAANAGRIADAAAAAADRIADQERHATELLSLINTMAPVLVTATKTLEAMEKGAAHVAEQVASSHNTEYRGLRDELRNLMVTLDERKP